MTKADDDSPGQGAAHAYFKGTEERATKGSAMSMIGNAKTIEIAKTARLKAARQQRDDAQAIISAEMNKDVPNKKPRKKKQAI